MINVEFAKKNRLVLFEFIYNAFSKPFANIMPIFGIPVDSIM